MNPSNARTYAHFSWFNTLREVIHALRSRKETQQVIATVLERLHRDESRISQLLGRPFQQLNMLEIGAGQRMERARYFAIHNQVTVLEQDVISHGINLASYWRMIQQNGFGRFIKTVGRKALLVDYHNQQSWKSALNVKQLPLPKILQGSICEVQPPLESFDLIVSWSTFEHLPDPQQALHHVIQALKPGGAFLIGIHLYTSNSGHHDIRAFTDGDCPPWGHLRSSTCHLIQPSSYLNQWRLREWRSLFTQAAPGHQEFLEFYGSVEQLTPDLRAELEEYSLEELYTVDAFYLWRKP
ncbi:MAG: class I SAM-dependent methyltransferase [Oculatellaceae cyanobacterium Prado106]|jgi:SAM-dependent methyltransferase|nr:class I SAM-dependent methyltransferase [Oculatellaceae cyanobacterium Prado106]